LKRLLLILLVWSLTVPTLASAQSNVTTSGLTSGVIPYANGSASLADAANLFWDSTNNRFGVGVYTPSDAFEVNGRIATYHASAAATAGWPLRFYTNTTGSTKNTIGEIQVLQQNTNMRTGYFALLLADAAAPAEVLRVTSEGKLGVGVNNPQQKLHVKGRSWFENASTTHIIDLVPGTTSGNHLITSDYTGGAAYIPLALSGRGTAGDLYLDTSGNVGVGTTAPNGLQISAAVSETARGADNVRIGVLAGTPRIIFEDSGQTQWEIDNSGGDLRFYTPNSVQMCAGASCSASPWKWDTSNKRQTISYTLSNPSFSNSHPLTVDITTSGTRSATGSDFVTANTISGMYIKNSDSSGCSPSCPNLGDRTSTTLFVHSVEGSGFNGTAYATVNLYEINGSTSATERGAHFAGVFYNSGSGAGVYGYNGFVGVSSSASSTGLVAVSLNELNCQISDCATKAHGFFSQNINSSFGTTTQALSAYTVNATRNGSGDPAWKYAFLLSPDGVESGARYYVRNEGTIVVDAPSGTSNRLLDLRLNGTTKFYVSNLGDALMTTAIIANFAGSGDRAVCVHASGTLYAAAGTSCP